MTGFIWTDEIMAYAKTRYLAGESAGEIAEAFKTTRNAVCGKLARLGIYRGKKLILKPQPAKPKRQPKPSQPVLNPVRTITLPAIGQARPASSYSRGYRPRREPKVDIAPPVMEHVQLMARTGCAFPTNNGRPFLFCNAELDNSKSAYCAHHRQRMYTQAGKAA